MCTAAHFNIASEDGIKPSRAVLAGIEVSGAQHTQQGSAAHAIKRAAARPGYVLQQPKQSTSKLPVKTRWNSAGLCQQALKWRQASSASTASSCCTVMGLKYQQSP